MDCPWIGIQSSNWHLLTYIYTCRGTHYNDKVWLLFTSKAALNIAQWVLNDPHIIIWFLNNTLLVKASLKHFSQSGIFWLIWVPMVHLSWIPLRPKPPYFLGHINLFLGSLICISADGCILWHMYLNHVLQQPSTAGGAKTKADIPKKEFSFLLVSLVLLNRLQVTSALFLRGTF